MAAKQAYPCDEPLLTTKEAARFLRLSHRTLEGFRVRGSGHRFIKAGRVSGLASSITCRYSQLGGEAVLFNVGEWGAKGVGLSQKLPSV